MVSKFSSALAQAKLVVTILPTRWIPLSNKYLQHHFDACGFFLKQGMVRWLVRWVVDQNAAHNWQNERFARRQYIQHILYRRQYIQYILKRRQYIQHILYTVCIVHCLLYKIHSIRPTSPTHLVLVGTYTNNFVERKNPSWGGYPWFRSIVGLFQDIMIAGHTHSFF